MKQKGPLHFLWSTILLFTFCPMRRKKNKKSRQNPYYNSLRAQMAQVWWNPGLNYAGARLKSPWGKKDNLSISLHSENLQCVGKGSWATLSLAAVSIMTFKYNAHNMCAYCIDIFLYIKYVDLCILLPLNSLILFKNLLQLGIALFVFTCCRLFHC